MHGSVREDTNELQCAPRGFDSVSNFRKTPHQIKTATNTITQSAQLSSGYPLESFISTIIQARWNNDLLAVSSIEHST